MYSFTSRVRYSETDETGNLSLRSLMNYLQDCCLFQSESLGVGPDYLKGRHRLWLLSGWQVVIDRYPRMFEKIIISTLPYEFTGCLGWRNVSVSDENGICIVRANSPLDILLINAYNTSREFLLSYFISIWRCYLWQKHW